MMTNIRTQEDQIKRTVIKLNVMSTGIIFGILAGFGLFIATIWLVIKGGPNPGPHLALLNQYFPGYSVTWSGSLIGFFYAFIVGLISGALLGAVYNRLTR
jgi:hypothetical protein